MSLLICLGQFERVIGLDTRFEPANLAVSRGNLDPSDPKTLPKRPNSDRFPIWGSQLDVTPALVQEI